MILKNKHAREAGVEILNHLTNTSAFYKDTADHR